MISWMGEGEHNKKKERKKEEYVFTKTTKWTKIGERSAWRLIFHSSSVAFRTESTIVLPLKEVFL